VHITLASVVSLNGKITRGDESNIHAWTSAEDWQHFLQLRDRHEVVVLDRPTYEQTQPKPKPATLRVVLTRSPERYQRQEVPGQLEFMAAETPQKLVDHIASRGYTTVLLAGGATLTSDFLAAGLVDELYLTLEPYLFGLGKPLLAARQLDVSLRLLSCTPLNERGTLLAHYAVHKSA